MDKPLTKNYFFGFAYPTNHESQRKKQIIHSLFYYLLQNRSMKSSFEILKRIVHFKHYKNDKKTKNGSIVKARFRCSGRHHRLPKLRTP